MTKSPHSNHKNCKWKCLACNLIYWKIWAFQQDLLLSGRLRTWTVWQGCGGPAGPTFYCVPTPTPQSDVSSRVSHIYQVLSLRLQWPRQPGQRSAVWACAVATWSPWAPAICKLSRGWSCLPYWPLAPWPTGATDNLGSLQWGLPLRNCD